MADAERFQQLSIVLEKGFKLLFYDDGIGVVGLDGRVEETKFEGTLSSKVKTSNARARNQ